VAADLINVDNPQRKEARVRVRFQVPTGLPFELDH